MREQLTVFQQVLTDSIMHEYADIPKEQALPDVFSEDFKSWVRKYQKPKKSPVLTVLKGILIAAIIAALLAGAALAIPAVREAMIKFFFVEELESGSFYITYDPQQAATAPDYIETAYAPNYMTEGFFLIERVVDPSITVLFWSNDADEMVSYVQAPIDKENSENSWAIDSETISRHQVAMGGYLVEVFVYEDIDILIWTNNEYVFTLQVPSSFEDAELQKIFAGFGPIK